MSKEEYNHNLSNCENYEKIYKEFFKNKPFFSSISEFMKKPKIIETDIQGVPGLPEELENLVISRLFGALGENSNKLLLPGLFDKIENFLPTSQLNNTKINNNLPLNDRLKEYLVENPDAIYLPLLPTSQLTNTQEFILNQNIIYPDLQEIYSKANFAKISRDIHSETNQDIQQIAEILGFSEKEIKSVQKNLKKIIPKSEIVDLKSENPFNDLLYKSFLIVKESDTGKVFIKNDSAAGFGVIDFSLEELNSIIKSGDLKNSYIKIITQKLLLKSNDFKDYQKLENQLKLFLDFKNIAIQEGLNIKKETSYQYMYGNLIADTDNLVDDTNHQHYGNQVRLGNNMSEDFIKASKILTLMMYLKSNNQEIAKETVLEAITEISKIPYYGMDGIIDQNGDAKIIEFNMRITGVTPSILRLSKKFLEKKELPPKEYLTRNVVLKNYSLKELNYIASKIKSFIEPYDPYNTVDIYSILALKCEVGDSPLIQIIIKKLPNETDESFKERSKKLIYFTENATNNITTFTRQYQKEVSAYVSTN